MIEAMIIPKQESYHFLTNFYIPSSLFIPEVRRSVLDFA